MVTKRKPRMRNLDEPLTEEIREEVLKKRIKARKIRLTEIEIERQCGLEHPILKKFLPYIQVGAFAFTVSLLVLMFWIISQLPALNVPL